MKTRDFYYDLPAHLIAQVPAINRVDSRLLVLDSQTGQVTDRKFSDLVDLLHAGDLLVMNNTRVIPARLLGRKDSGGKIEVLIERILNDHEVLAQVRASKSPRVNSHLLFDDDVLAVVQAREQEFYRLQFQGQPTVVSILEQIGKMPLPPYIERVDDESDRERYQTVYASEVGAVAAPTAGLHFDDALLEKIRARGIDIEFVTLHVGAGTFQSVRVTDIRQHHMHKEWIQVPSSVVAKIKNTKRAGHRVIAVGTTTVRSLETAALSGKLGPYEGETDIFIYPGFEFQVVDALITNFHLPESTLLMLVCAFGGYAYMMQAYQHAVAEEYRFFSYGDAMFIQRSK